MGNSRSKSKIKRQEKCLPNQEKEIEHPESKQANPNQIHEDQDHKEEENEKNFGEYEDNAMVSKTVDRKNCMNLI